MTHGEAYILKKDTLDFSQELKDIVKVFMNLPGRMKRSDAVQYYNNKAKEVFKSLGYEYKKKEEYVPEIQEVPMKDFDSVDDYYDYFEAMRFRDSLMVA